MNRIDKKFEQLREEGKKALIPFITCGDPSLEETVELVLSMEKAGANIVELGIPYSDPLADGEVIQASYFRALSTGIKVNDILDMIGRLRSKTEIPLVVMVYYNIVFCYGVEKFLTELKLRGVDGIIVPDIPLEERCELKESCEKENIKLIPLVAPNSKERIKSIVETAEGFIYCVSVLGTTGERISIGKNISEYINLVKKYTKIPCCLGFGISSVETVREVKDYCDGIIIGSAIIKRISEGKSANERKEKLYNYLKEIRVALDTDIYNK